MYGVYGNTKARRTHAASGDGGGRGWSGGEPDGCERSNNIAGRLIERAGSFSKHGARLDATASLLFGTFLVSYRNRIFSPVPHNFKPLVPTVFEYCYFVFFSYIKYTLFVSTAGVNYNILIWHISFFVCFWRTAFVHSAIGMDVTILDPRFSKI